MDCSDLVFPLPARAGFAVDDFLLPLTTFSFFFVGGLDPDGADEGVNDSTCRASLCTAELARWAAALFGSVLDFFAGVVRADTARADVDNVRFVMALIGGACVSHLRCGSGARLSLGDDGSCGFTYLRRYGWSEPRYNRDSAAPAHSQVVNQVARRREGGSHRMRAHADLDACKQTDPIGQEHNPCGLLHGTVRRHTCWLCRRVPSRTTQKMSVRTAEQRIYYLDNPTHRIPRI